MLNQIITLGVLTSLVLKSKKNVPKRILIELLRLVLANNDKLLGGTFQTFLFNHNLLLTPGLNYSYVRPIDLIIQDKKKSKENWGHLPGSKKIGDTSLIVMR